MICFLALSTSSALLAQQHASESNQSFALGLESTPGHLKLTGLAGCAFKELNFTLLTDDDELVSAYGMEKENDQTSKSNPTLANFLIRIQRTAEGIQLERIRGTAWERLSFNCPNQRCIQKISFIGME